MGEFETYFSCSNLLCHEAEEEVCFFETEAEDDENLYLNDDDDDEYIDKLVQGETSCISDYPITIRNKWLQCARLNAIEWMFNVCIFFLFFVYLFFSFLIGMVR